MIDVDFSLALHNRTGKYFIGRDIISSNLSRISRVRYWRLATSPQAEPPQGLAAKVIGRLAVDELRLRSQRRRFGMRLRPPRPVLHLDPLTVLFHRLSPQDVVLCHDIGPLSHPGLFEADVVAGYVEAYKQIAKVRPHMVFVSKASQRAFHARASGEFASSRVIYPSLRTELSDRSLSPLAIERPFLLTVGYVGTRKNQLAAIEAFGLSGLAAHNVRYVICGGREPGYEAVAAAAEKTPGVVLLSYVKDAELNWLYANADGFVLPSLLEGFGVPVAEANRAGLVPIVSRDSVLEEVAGEGALLVDPLDRREIADAMARLIAMPESEKEARREALSRAIARFSQHAFQEAWRVVTAEAARRSHLAGEFA